MAKVKTDVELERVNINLPKELVDKVKEYGRQVGVNNTNAFIFLLHRGLDNNWPIASNNDFENDFLALLGENLLNDETLINKLFDKFKEMDERSEKK